MSVQFLELIPSENLWSDLKFTTQLKTTQENKMFCMGSESLPETDNEKKTILLTN